MATRSVRDYTDSEKVNSLSDKAEILFARLLTKADDFGSFHATPMLVKANLFPLKLDTIREADITRWITECEKSGLIVLYEAESKRFLRIINYGQRLRNMRNKFPDPPEELMKKFFSQQLAASCRDKPPEEKRSRREEELEEEVEVEENARAREGLPSPTNFFKKFSEKLLSDELVMEGIEMQTKKKPDAKILKLFHAHLAVEGKSHNKYTEYCSHLRNWLAKQNEYGTEKKSGGATIFNRADHVPGAIKLKKVD